MAILALDIGTTHCKAGVFASSGELLSSAGRPTPAQQDAFQFYDPQRLWDAVLAVAGAAQRSAGHPPIVAIGVAGMAETGLLLDRRSGLPRSPLLPWFDTSAAPQAKHIERALPGGERFGRFGIYCSFKVSLAKLLWWRDRDPDSVAGAVWLSAPDYIAFRLTGELATDYSLAGRTYAFDLQRRAWDADWLRRFDLAADTFAPAGPATRPIGVATGVSGLPIGDDIPVAIAGHDHICAAFAAGVGAGGWAFDSMGTAEALLGALPARSLGELEHRSGLSFGLLSDGAGMYWLGGLSSSGGALEWLRRLLGDPPLSYQELAKLAEQAGRQPGDIMFMPYLAGAGAPRPDPELRGALLGLDARHGRADIVKAVLEGTAYQMEAIRRAATAIADRPVERIVTAGGGTRNRRWLQIKADVYGARIDALHLDEATLQGAALLAGVAGGVYAGVPEAREVAAAQHAIACVPDGERHAAYRHRFDEFQYWRGFLGETG